MKNILILLLILCANHAHAQKEVRDTLFIRNDSLFIGKVQVFYEPLIDTAELHSRYMQIESIIEDYNKEKDAIKEKIAFFVDNKPEMMRTVPVKQTLPKPKKQAPKKQPATAPKKN